MSEPAHFRRMMCSGDLGGDDLHTFFYPLNPVPETVSFFMATSSLLDNFTL
jgi:hypothetical protein